MPPARTAARPSWHTIPAVLRDAIATRTGPVDSVVTPPGGYTPGLAARLTLDDGRRVFVKALPASHPLADFYRHEAAAATRMPAQVPAPALHWHAELAGWLVLAYDDVDGRHPDIGPAGRDLDAILHAITAAQQPVTGLPHAAGRLGPWTHGWAELAIAPPPDLPPWAAGHLAELAVIERDWLPYADDGGTLVHGDARPDNMLVTGRGVVLIDWAYAMAGAPWLDLADLVPQLILAGHTPASAEQQLSRLAGWRDAPARAVTSYAAACGGYWARSARLPSPADAPHVRDYQARAAAAAVEWLAWRWGQHPAA